MRNWALLGGLGAGASAMYLLDPRSRRRRLDRVRQDAFSAARDSGAALSRAARDAAHRVRGLGARTARALSADTAGDDVLEARVRARLGRLVSHPHAIAVTAEAGCVTLQGPVLAQEAGPLVEGVCRVRGVGTVIDRLDVHETADGVPVLQGAAAASRRERWRPALRLAASAAGGGLVAWGAVRRDWAGAAAGTAGAGLLVGGLADRTAAREAGNAPPVDLVKTVLVAAPRPHVFALWSRPENLPRFFSRVLDVKDLGGGRQRWTAVGPRGRLVRWDVRLTARVPGRLVAWQSLPGALVHNSAAVRFDEVGAGATRVSVHITYRPSARALAAYAAELFGAHGRLDEDLRRMKRFGETGREPRDVLY